MTAFFTTTWKAHAAGRAALVLAMVSMFAATTATVAQPAPQKTPSLSKPQTGLQLNDREYFETRGLNVLVFTNQYNGMFFDEKTAGIEIIQHGVRMATGGAVRLSPTPEQWDQIPKVIDRKVDKATKTITCLLHYEAFGFDSRLVVTPEGSGFRVAVYVDKPVPDALAGRAGLNLEFLPSRFFEHTYLADGKPGIFPRYPTGPTRRSPTPRRSASSRATRPSTIVAGASMSKSTRWLPARRSSSLRRTASAASPSRPSPANSSCWTGETSPRTAGSSSALCWR